MAKARASRVRKYLFKDLVRQLDEGIDNRIETEYTFSNGRTFKRRVRSPRPFQRQTPP